jgi:glycosyltransferase involved in cell wall biosynthesis
VIKLTLAISTINNRIEKLLLPPVDSRVSCIVVHQKTEGLNHNSEEVIDQIKNRDDIVYIELSYDGLSKSRNVAIQNCKTEYIYILDDDIQLMPNAIDSILKGIESKSAAYAFKHAKKQSDFSVSNRFRYHTFFTASAVSSIDMCLNVEFIKQHNLTFDERFGLGTNLPSGEEYILLTDILKKKGIVSNIPILIALHPQESSGVDFYSTENKIKAKKEMFRRVTGRKMSLLSFLYFVIKCKVLLQKGRFFYFIKYYFFK